MQTFLPYADFAESARALDQKRLGKQRVEVVQIVRALTRETYGWKHHPAVLMWRGYEEALGASGVPVPPRSQAEPAAAGDLPPRLGDEALHRSHRSSLLRKEPEHYGPILGDEPDDLECVWPVRKSA